MPELPEVETICRGLEAAVAGRTIVGVDVLRAEPIRGSDAAAFRRRLEQATIEGVTRRGKLIVMSLSGELVLIGHLKMTGQMVICEGAKAMPKHTHVVVRLDDGRRIRFTDARRFGYLQLLDRSRAESLLQSLGPEPLDKRLNKEVFWRRLKRRPRGRIKNLLLDQSFLAGVGNIYSDEMLHAAGIRPTRRAGSLRRAESDRLHSAMRGVLREAIRRRGTSISDYRDSSGRRGGYARQLRVYGREGEVCPRCGAMVKRRRMGSRSTHYCPGCQM